MTQNITTVFFTELTAQDRDIAHLWKLKFSDLDTRHATQCGWNRKDMIPVNPIMFAPQPRSIIQFSSYVTRPHLS